MSLKEHIEAYMACAKSRKVVVFVYTWPSFVCLMIASGGVPPLTDAVMLLGAVTLVGFGVYFYNDIMDLKDDLRNAELGNLTKANKPLGRGKVSKSLLARFAAVSAVTGLVLAFAIDVRVLLLQVTYLVLGVLYSTEPVRLKKRFICKQLTIGAGCIIANLSGGFAGGAISPAVIYMAAMNFSIAIGVNPVMDIPDLGGDEAMGVRTVASVLGPSMTVRVSLAVLAAIAAATAVGYAQIGFNQAVPILVTIIIAAWIYAATPLLKRWDEPEFANSLIFKKTFPLYLMLQFVPVLGVLTL